MILYTPLSEYDIFPRNDPEQLTYQHYQNVMLKCKDMGNGKKEIVQILSTDPADYMNPSLQPGQWLDS